MLPHHQSQTQLLPAEDCIEALIQAGGNSRLAAERLFGSNAPNALASLTASIAQDPLANAKLNEQLRTLTTLQAFDTLNAAKVMMDAVMTELTPAEFVKFYLAQQSVISSLTSQPSGSAQAATAQLDPRQLQELLLSKMPPQARRAFLTLIEGGAGGGTAQALGEAPETTGDYATLEHLSGGLVSDGPREPRSSDEASA